jgi:hypothetical protein
VSKYEEGEDGDNCGTAKSGEGFLWGNDTSYAECEDDQKGDQIRPQPIGDEKQGSGTNYR